MGIGIGWASRVEVVFWGFLLLGLGSCRGLPAGAIEHCDTEITLPSSVSTDILFVVDNSGSMAEEQQKVIEELSSFIEALISGPVENDFQVGVVTTSVTLNASAECDGGNANFKDYPEQSGRLQLGVGSTAGDGSRILNSSDPDLLEKFEALIRQGTKGSGQEMGLEAMRLALSPTLQNVSTKAEPPGNQGFLRPGSRLLVVLVSDEDDCSDPTKTAVALRPACGDSCSDHDDCDPYYVCNRGDCQLKICDSPEGWEVLAPVASYVNFLAALTDAPGSTRPREVFVALIGAVDPDDPSVPSLCSGGGTDAFGAASRYSDLVAAMGNNGLGASICSDDYGDSLEKIGELVSAPHVLDLSDNPPDPRLLSVEVIRDGEVLRCRYEEEFTYEPPAGDLPARVTLINACRLQHGDDVRLSIFCVG